MNYFKNTLSVTSLVASSLLTGCMTQQIANTKHVDDAALKQLSSTKQTPEQICSAATTAVKQGHEASLNFYTPLHLEQAADNVEDGLEQIKSKETLNEGIKKCFKASKLIENGLAMKPKIESALKDSIDQLEMLKKVDSGKKFTDDIQDSADDVVDIAKKIEAGKMNEAMQDQAELIQDMLEIEIEIVTEKNLTAVEAMLERADDADADDLAPKTFEKAENELESAHKFIQSNYRKNKEVENISSLAMRAARHAYFVAKEVETFKELKPDAAEEKVLYIESLLERINKKLSQEPIVGNSLYDQSTLISKQIDTALEL